MMLLEVWTNCPWRGASGTLIMLSFLGWELVTQLYSFYGNPSSCALMMCAFSICLLHGYTIYIKTKNAFMENTSTHLVRAYIKEKIYIKMMVYGGMEVGNGDQKEIHTLTHTHTHTHTRQVLCDRCC